MFNCLFNQTHLHGNAVATFHESRITFAHPARDEQINLYGMSNSEAAGKLIKPPESSRHIDGFLIAGVDISSLFR
jgi:hypothetical protein